MAIKNFIPNLFAADVLQERDKLMVAAKHCNRDYEGQIKEQGDRVKINTVAPVITKAYTKNTDIADPDNVSDASQFLDIDQAKYAHVFIDDVDRRQALNDGFWNEAKRQMSLALADDIDGYIFGLYANGVSATPTTVTSANIVAALAEARQKLREANVPQSETLYLEVSPAIYTKLVLARIAKETMNTKVIDGAEVPTIYGFGIYESNNVCSVGGINYCFARTKRAISLAVQVTETEAYRPQKRFGDAIKSLQVWGAKVQAPKELIVLPLTVGAES